MARRIMVWTPILCGVYIFFYSVQRMYSEPYSIFVGLALLLCCFKLSEAMSVIADDLLLD
jgi:hypothetical protein